MAASTSDLEGLFSLPPELRWTIYSYIRDPNRGFSLSLTAKPIDVRWLLADRRLFADAAPHYCNPRYFSTWLQPSLPDIDDHHQASDLQPRQLIAITRMQWRPKTTLWSAFTQSIGERFGAQDATPDWLFEDASVLVKRMAMDVLLPQTTRDGRWSDCPPRLALRAVRESMNGIDRFTSLETLRVKMYQFDHVDRRAESAQQQFRGKRAETMVWSERDTDTEELKNLAPDGCTVLVEIAEFVGGNLGNAEHATDNTSTWHKHYFTNITPGLQALGPVMVISSVPTILSPSRSNSFRPGRQPFRRASTLHVKSDRLQGPVSFLNPTKARYTQFEPAIPEDEALPSRVSSQRTIAANAPSLLAPPTAFKPPQPTLTYQWTSRNSRKGRHTLLIDDDDDEIANTGVSAPQPTTNLDQVWRNIRRMFTSFPLWDISFDVAFLFTIGSAVWVLNGFFNVLPFSNPSSTFPGEVLYGGGITACIGILIFLIGGIFLVLEAINEDRADCFG